jgi:carbonic anhydrase/acetyltransferase-like protein (isoleucine patch superfamily)
MALYELDGVRVKTPADGAYWVAPNATVLGNVILGRDVSIWFNAVLRGDNEPISIGDGSNIQDGAVLHTDPGYPLTIGPRSLIGHQAMVHGCTIGTNTLIGIGAIVLNGCRIGDNCIIGAHTILAENKVIPDGSLVVGVPGRVVKPCTPEQIAKVRQDVADYVENGRRFAKGLKPQGR